MDWELCPRCRGNGTIVHPALSVWTAEDRDNDPEGFEQMMEGHYDIKCPECNGLRVISSNDSATYHDRRSEKIGATKLMAMESGDYELYQDASLY